jgi:two-component system LytT family sensor kinase
MMPTSGETALPRDPPPGDAFGATARGFARRWWRALAGLGLAIGILNFLYYWLDDVSRANAEPPWTTLVEELTASFGVALLLPFVVAAALRWRLDHPDGWRHAPFHVAAVLGFSALHTSWNWGTRAVLFPALGFGPYDYGAIPVRYAMEFPSDLIIYVVTLIITYLVLRSRRARDQELALSRLETRLSEARLDALRAQIHPHFLFNTLNAVSSVMYDDVEAADAMLATLADLLRLTMASPASHQTIPLGRELEILERYVDIMRLRFGDGLDVRVTVEPGVEEVPVPQLLLQPLVENALEHGTPTNGGPARVRVRARRDGVRMVLEVEDNGPGFRAGAGAPGAGRPGASRSDVGSGDGIGLANTRERLRALYGDAADLRVESSADGGARLVVEVPAP